jgi:hypothetical protein
MLYTRPRPVREQNHDVRPIGDATAVSVSWRAAQNCTGRMILTLISPSHVRRVQRVARVRLWCRFRVIVGEGGAHAKRSPARFVCLSSRGRILSRSGPTAACSAILRTSLKTSTRVGDNRAAVQRNIVRFPRSPRALRPPAPARVPRSAWQCADRSRNRAHACDRRRAPEP